MERAGIIIAVDEAAGFAMRRTVPTCYSIGVSEFTRWLAQARPFDEIIYAHGGRLDGKRDVCVTARAAAGRRDVQLLSRRQPSGVFHYIARRVASEGVEAGGDRQRTVAPAHGRAREPGDEAGRVLAMLARCAEAGRPCPTNREIAVALRIHCARRVRYLIDGLERGGVIAVEKRGQRITRIVTIAATGERTSIARTPVGVGFEKIGTGGKAR